MRSLSSCHLTVIIAALTFIAGGGQITAQVTTPPGSIAGMVVATGTEAPISGARIIVQGTSRGVLSDANGRFRLTGLSGSEITIEVRRVGFRPLTQRVTVGTETLRFALTQMTIELNAVVVTGQPGGVERRAIGNSITTIAAATDVQQSAVSTVGSLINGRAPGVVVTGLTGREGAGTTLNIRGRSTLSLSQQPLIYIDGVRVSNEVGTGPRTQGGGVVSRLNDIAPEDIESIEIIKGPSAGTLYGTEAANGVVQIITKKGGNGGQQFTASVREGRQWFQNYENRIATNYARDAAGNIVTLNVAKSEQARGTPLFETGKLRTDEMNFRGGSRELNYYLSSTYDHNSGIDPGNRLARYTGHANVTVAPSERFDVSSSLNIIKGKTLLGEDFGASRIFNAQYASPLTAGGPLRGFSQFPPEVIDAYYLNSQTINRLTGSVQMNHRPAHWFAQRLTLGLDQTSEDNQALQNFLLPPFSQFFSPAAAKGGINQDLRTVSYLTADYSGTVTAPLRPTLISAFSLGGQLYRKRADLTQVTATQFPAPNLTTAAAAAIRQGSQDFVENTTLGMYAQEQLSWRDRVFITGALRVDNNSAFGNDIHLVKYPKLSGSWVMSDEGFWGRLGAVDQFRLRAAYGQSGQQPDAFAALRTFAPTTGPGDQPIVTPQFPGNPNLKPERTTEFETGFEASLFKRIGIDFTYFTKQTKDAILLKASAPSSGFPNAQFVNIGRISNHGLELAVNASAIARRNLSLDVGGSLATTTDHIDDMGGLPFLTVVLPTQRNQQGFPIGAYFTKIVTSAIYDPTTKRAINALCDGGVNGRPGGAPVPCATAPQLFFGTVTPKMSGSVNTTLSLGRRIKLYALADYRKGNKLFDVDLFNRCTAFLLCKGNVSPETIDPRELYTYQNAGSLTVTDSYIRDASFWRLRELSATLTGPDSWARRLNAGSMSLTIAGRNLHTWTRYSGLDPESHSAFGNQTSAAEQAVQPTLAQFITTFRITY